VFSIAPLRVRTFAVSVAFRAGEEGITWFV
jgi:hypothetical protein